MTPPWPLFLLVAIGQGLAMIAAMQAWPLLRRMERDGLLKKPVPDLFQGNTNTWRTGALLWATPIPSDRRRLRRWLLIHRIAQISSFGLILTTIVAFSNGSPNATPADPGAAPAVRLDVHGPSK